MKQPEHDKAPDPKRAVPDPLDQIAQDHLRQRQICDMLDTLAGLAAPDPELAAGVLPNFDTALSRHVHDEEDDLFPLLRKRSEPGDDINDTLDRLARNHADSLKLAVRVRQIVTALANGPVLPDLDEAKAMTGFAAHERHHLIVENAIVLPLARARLTDQDLAVLSLRMLERRGGRTAKGAEDA